jgi:hypothetical protein
MGASHKGDHKGPAPTMMSSRGGIPQGSLIGVKLRNQSKPAGRGKPRPYNDDEREYFSVPDTL